ncbi:hypothetical protein PR048_002597 [Dryococelus australis]|uniref:ATP-dependent DNA helicase n=1 Tax=Dryococelus australis TaxID=614101 RepID=A0ABQ9IKR2_9NEOP|nr:hypothetical protein PR048_002597 [Dryococelus australis]
MSLKGRQQVCHRLDVVCRVFKVKLDVLMGDIHKNQIFGMVSAYTYNIEFQKRGLPLGHILIILDKGDKIAMSEAVDETVRADIPDREAQPADSTFQRRFVAKLFFTIVALSSTGDNDVAGALERAHEKHTHLRAFFHYNSQHKLLHHCGTREKGGFNTISQIHNVSPQANEELLCLHLLLHNVRGPTSFEDLHTVRHTVHPTYKLACLDLLLLDRDDIYQVTMYKAARWSVPGRLRVLLTHIIFHCNIADPPPIYNNLKPYLLDDAGGDLEFHLGVFNKTFADYGLPCPDVGHVHDLPQYEVDERNEANRMHNLLNADENVVFTEVVASVAAADSDTEARCSLFFVDGPAFVLIAKIVCPVAWTSIASILSAGGSTSHALFKLPVLVMQGSVCDISAQSLESELLRKCSLIISDEAPMAPKEALHCVDRLLRDVTKNDCTKFGGKVLLLGDDFRQVLPVVNQEGRADQVNVCLKNSPLWTSFKQLCLRINTRVDQGQEEFQQFLLHISEGT